jgi:hypothetical protein
MIKKPTAYLITIALITSLLSGSANATTPAVTKPPCRVDMPLAHESTKYAENYRVLAVKVNLKVICDKLITHLALHVDLLQESVSASRISRSF